MYFFVRVIVQRSIWPNTRNDKQLDQHKSNNYTQQRRCIEQAPVSNESELRSYALIYIPFVIEFP